MINQIIDDKYKILSQIGEGAMSDVFKAEDVETHRVVALKILKERILSVRVEDVLMFQREANSVVKLDHPSIVRIYAIGHHNQVPYIIMELLEGEGLNLLLEQRRFNLDETIDIISQITDVLSYVHSKGIIHRDIKPSNIILCGPQIKMLDFGLAQIIEARERIDESFIVGTLGYMSPEQSGIIPQPVDERSDLYSLGVIFYQMLARQMPFQGKDIKTIVDAQLNETQQSLSELNPDIPPIVQKIIGKLLHKDPETRYQTASGLKFDLEKVLRGERNFLLALRDNNGRVNYRPSLIGRDEELGYLKELFVRAQSGDGSMCLVGGEAGQGKSRLVNELRSYVYTHGGTFIEGKCFQQSHKFPYKPFSEALSDYVRKVSFLSKEHQDQTKEHMKNILGSLGGVLEQINPLIATLIGPSDPLIPLEPEREHRRFLNVASDFFSKIGTEDNPLVLCLDDLQWADEASLNLLEEILTEIGQSHVLILGTYRNNEVGTAHRLVQVVQQAIQKAYAFEVLSVSSFDLSRTIKMLSFMLSQNPDNLMDIAYYILGKSKGNPFFILELTRQLVEQQVLFFAENRWVLDEVKLKTLRTPDNLLDIVFQRIKRLSLQAQEILTYGAIMGRGFPVRMIFNLIDRSKEEIILKIHELIEQNVLEWDRETLGRLLFLHDRIKEAFAQKILENERRALHLKVAKVMEEIHQEQKESVLFNLAYHYSEAGHVDKSLEFSVPAARRAVQTHANDQAIKYYHIAIQIMEDKGQGEGPLCVQIKSELVELYSLIGKNEQAIQLGQEILPLDQDPLDKVKVYRHIGTACFRKGDYLQCEDAIAKGLHLLGLKLPRTDGQVLRWISNELFLHILHCLFPGVFCHKEGAPAQEKYKEIIWTYTPLNWMYAITNVKKLAHGALFLLNMAEAKLDKCKDLVLATTGYAALCMCLPLFDRSLVYFRKALKMSQELNDEWGKGQTLQLMGYSYSWQGKYKEAIQTFQEAEAQFHQVGDLWELGMALNGLGQTYYFNGQYAKALNCFNEHMRISQKTGDDFGIAASRVAKAAAYVAMGEYSSAQEEADKALILSKSKELWTTVCLGLGILGYNFFERGDFEKAIPYLERAIDVYENKVLLKNFSVYLYMYLADGYIGQLENRGKNLKEAERNELIKKIKRICQKAVRRTRKWINYYGGALRVYARYHVLIHKPQKAQKLFQQSLAANQAINRKFELVKTNYEFGKFLNSQGKKQEAEHYWRQSYDVAVETGSHSYIKKCAGLLKIDRPGAPTNHS